MNQEKKEIIRKNQLITPRPGVELFKKMMRYYALENNVQKRRDK